MKKIGRFLIVLIAIIAIGKLESYSHYYIRKNCEVVKVDNYVVTVEDNMGRWWDFEGEGFMVGDKVDIEMFDNLTDEIKDDQIVGIKNHLTEITKKA
jgi:hypothetical protein